jgi:hemerythrin superfamily protein
VADGFEDIIRDHRKFERMLAEYDADPQDARAHEICTEIAFHAEAEESVLYPALRRLGTGEQESDSVDGVALGERAELEHGEVKAQIAHVLATPPIDLRELMTHIGRQVSAHAAFEEAEIWPRLRALIDAGDLHDALIVAKGAIRARAGTPMY